MLYSARGTIWKGLFEDIIAHVTRWTNLVWRSCDVEGRQVRAVVIVGRVLDCKYGYVNSIHGAIM